GCNLANFDSIESPLLEHAEDLLLAAFLRHQQHSLLGFAQHNFISTHAGFALWHAIKFNFYADAAPPAHLAGRTGQSRRAHVLNPDDRSRPHRFQTSLQQQLLEERITHLHIGPLRFRSLAEFLAGHGGAVDTVTPRLGADVDYRIALASRAGIEDFILPHQAHGKSVHQRIARVAWLKLRFTTQVRHAETVAVGSDSAHHAFENGMIAMNLCLRGDCRLGCPAWAKPGSSFRRNRAKAKRVHHRHWPGSHSEDVAQNSADPGGCSLKRLDKRRVIVRFDLESASPAVANVDDARVLARSLQHALAARGQPLQVHSRRFVRAMFAPHDAEDSQLGQRRLAVTQELLDFFVLVGSQSVLPESLRRK